MTSRLLPHLNKMHFRIQKRRNLIWRDRRKRKVSANLCDQKLGVALWKFALLTGQDHLQHVTMEFLHDNKHSFWSLKHTLQVYNTRMVQILQEKNNHVKYIKENSSLHHNVLRKSVTFLQWCPHPRLLSCHNHVKKTDYL